MRVLPLDLRKHGFDLHQVIRDGAVAIYRQSKPETTIEAFEVIKIGKIGARVINGTHLEATERYPTSEAWGQLGWTYQTKPEALAKFQELCNDA